MNYTEVRKVIENIMPDKDEVSGFQIMTLVEKQIKKLVGYGTLYRALDELVNENVLTRRWETSLPNTRRLYKRIK